MIHRFAFLFLLALAVPVFAATYYIDYAAADDSANGTAKGTPWKRCPGMIGFAGSYSHAAGDQFIFKGGVTWTNTCLPLTLAYSGTAGHVDTYAADATWYTGGSWSYPVFDGEEIMGQDDRNVALLYMAPGGRDYIRIDSLKFVRVNNGVTSISGTAIDLLDGSYIEISNCWVEPTCTNGFGYEAYTKNSSGLNFHHNIIRKTLRCVIYAVGSGNGGPFVVDGAQFHDNDWQGPGGLFAGDYHIDGLMVGDPYNNSTSPTVTNLSFYNNKFYGDWTVGTAMFYSNAWTSGTKIYNNVFSFENTTPTQNYLSPGFVNFGRHDTNIEIYNNTFASDNMHGYNSGTGESYGAPYAISVATPTGGTVTVKNNIFSWVDVAIGVDPPATLVAEHNLYYLSTACKGDLIYAPNGTQYRTLEDVQAAGYETESPPPTPAVSAPLFVTAGNGATGSANWALQSSSPARGAGVQLNSIFTTDILGVTRGSSWDIGAYQYAAGAPDTTPPTVTSATIPTGGTTLVLAMSEPCTIGAGGGAGLAITMSGGAATVGSVSGTNTSSFTATLSRTVYQNETGTFSYLQPTHGIADVAGNDLATIASAAVTNSSTQTAPSITPAASRRGARASNLVGFSP
jgi:hypothetical protein